jgi:hypothetical protein
MGSRQIVLVSTAGFSVLNTGIFWREAKTKRLFSQCRVYLSPPPAAWKCSVYLSPPPAAWKCSVYLSLPPAAWKCRVYLSPPPAARKCRVYLSPPSRDFPFPPSYSFFKCRMPDCPASGQSSTGTSPVPECVGYRTQMP